jgi:hypothetical protein
MAISPKDDISSIQTDPDASNHTQTQFVQHKYDSERSRVLKTTVLARQGETILMQQNGT